LDPPVAAVLVVPGGDVTVIGRLDPIELEVGDSVVAAVERALLLLVRMVSEVDDSELRMRLTRLAAMGAPDRNFVVPSLLSQQVVFTIDLLRGQ
jgi:hypothetical protein